MPAVSLLLCLALVVQTKAQTTVDTDSAIANLKSEFECVRKAAFDALSEQGIQAFDQLLNNRDSADIEQRLAIDRLLKQCQIDWNDVAISESTIQLLARYTSLAESRRKTVIGMIAKNRVPEYPVVLARLAKHEPSESLSQLAALTIINESLHSRESVMVKLKHQRQVHNELGGSNRHAAQLLQLWCEVDLETFSKKWLEVTSQAIAHTTPHNEPLEKEVLARHIEIAIASLLRGGNPEVANELAIQWLQTIETDDSLKFALEILGNFELQQACDQFSIRFKKQIEDNPLLAYGLANIYSNMGYPEQTAIFQTIGDRIAKTHPVTGLEVASRLKRLGHYQSAEHVFNHTIENTHEHMIAQARARLLLAELLHEQNRNGHAAELLQPLLDLLRDDAAACKILDSKTALKTDQIAARQILFAALEAYATGDSTRQTDLLLEGIINHPSDVPLLIEAHRCLGRDHESSPIIHRLCMLKQKELLNQITELQTDPSSPWAKKERNRKRRIAVLCNRLAWLAVHTDNEPAFAIQFAQLANQYCPGNPYYLDTESHCWLAMGNRTKAIDLAREAHRLLPKNLYFQQELKSLERNNIKTAQRQTAPTKRTEK